ncbi:type II toxin-antitoxin system VapC family toxin [Pseudomonas sp. SP16.1]|uniref:type II toxin-antitoxin system VapC family toxin n=1 Tax=Pseudomonas sp. SP16.1 TaxID=3458854 RepID=UPI00404681BA
MIVLDTHALIWWVSDDERLSSPAAEAIERELGNDGQILVSAITPWEIAMLLEKGRMALAMDLDEWLSAVESIEGVSVVPISPRVAVQSVRLPGEFHKDPADRLIVALARELNAPLLTADEKIQGYPHIKWIW